MNSAELLRARRDRENARKRQKRAEARVAKVKAEKPASAPPLPISGGTERPPDEKRRKLSGKRFVFTSAQNNTDLHEGFWAALQRFCGANNAKLYVSRFSYNKNGWQQHGGVSQDDDESSGLWYDPRITDYVLDEQTKIADGLVFCGELDILPTASTPLATLSNYTGPNSGIVPHAKVQLQSYATMKHQDAKFMYTTGACTLRNYIERKAGQVATFHHVFGALYVEVDEDGKWFARQLMADDSGAFYDLDLYYTRDFCGVIASPNVGVVTLGDIHIEKIDHRALNTALDMLDVLKPEHVFIHDVLDFETRNHHNLRDPHFLADQYYNSSNSVKSNVEAAARFLHGIKARYPFTTIHVVRSNHDQALERWLKDQTGSLDPANAHYWHWLNWNMHHGIRSNQNFDIFKMAVQDVAKEDGLDLDGIHFVQEDESVVILDIEHGMHGHRGINGARGNPKAFRQLGRKTNTGHSHSAYVLDGNWVAGVLGNLDMKYNSGPSSWSHSNIITYPNGKRCMITQRGPKWRA